jgi:DNA-damage-inducible protein J
MSRLEEEEAMSTDTVVRARIDGQVKEKAAAVLNEMGLSVSDAIRLMLVRVAAEKALPFKVKVPNAKTEAAFRASDRDEGVTRAKDAADMFAKLGI